MIVVAANAEASEARPSRRIVWICSLLAASVFALDITPQPLSAAASVFYVGVVVLSLWLPESRHTFIAASLVSILTVVGFLFSLQSELLRLEVANHLLSLAAIWLVAIGGRWLVMARHQREKENLRRIEREADRARLAKARFIDASSNDIRQHLQTLNLLNGALQKLADRPRTQEIVAKQGIAITELGEFMNSLLELNELESGEIELDITDVSIADAMETLREEFAYQAEAKGLQLNFDCEQGVARSDRLLLSRIVRVFISNAIRYTNEGSITVSATFEPEGLRITVADTGIGIAPDEVSRIFDEFYRVDNSPARRQGGLGLGLSIVEHSIRHLNAELEVESEPGRGSSFSLLMPAAA